jgi:hypothetical protein
MFCCGLRNNHKYLSKIGLLAIGCPGVADKYYPVIKRGVKKQ